MIQDKYIFTLEIAVRDYELDSEGIVNNAIYLHYLEHTRHAFVKQEGIPFGSLTREGLIPVVRRMEIDYHTPLRSGLFIGRATNSHSPRSEMTSAADCPITGFTTAGCSSRPPQVSDSARKPKAAKDAAPIQHQRTVRAGTITPRASPRSCHAP